MIAPLLIPPHTEDNPLLWQVSQQDFARNLCAAATLRTKTYQANQSAIWDAVDSMAHGQPFVSSADAPTLDALQQHVARLKSVADDLVVIGTGGASLGAQTLCGLLRQPPVHFIDNCDATTIRALFTTLNPARTAWVIISKSGATIETLATSLALIHQYAQVSSAEQLAQRTLVITSPTPSPLRDLAIQQGWLIMQHAALGGRYSVFSASGLVPVAFVGMDVHAIAHTAQQAWNRLLETRDETLFTAASCFAASLPDQPIHVLMAYGDCLRSATQWYKQLWGESLGKNTRGPTPVTAIGSLDQHSQLQLYLDGPRDKLFTLIIPDDTSDALPLFDCALPGFDYLRGHSMQHVMHASAIATGQTLAQHHVPVRLLKAPLNGLALSELMVRMMLETMLVAAMLEINPFDQPAVEEGKERARAALGIAQTN